MPTSRTSSKAGVHRSKKPQLPTSCAFYCSWDLDWAGSWVSHQDCLPYFTSLAKWSITHNHQCTEGNSTLSGNIKYVSLRESLLTGILFPSKSQHQGSVVHGTYFGPQCLELVSFLWTYENIWELKSKVIDSKIQKENCRIPIKI